LATGPKTPKLWMIQYWVGPDDTDVDELQNRGLGVRVPPLLPGGNRILEIESGEEW